MLSYLSNRHYHLLTKELPEELRIDQPKVVYLPAHHGEKIDIRSENRKESRLKIKKSRQMQETLPSIGDW